MDRRAGLPAAHLVPQAALGGHRLRHPEANLRPQVAILPHQVGANHHLAGYLVDHHLLSLALLREDHLPLPRPLRPHRAVKVLGKEESSHIPFRAPEGSMFQASLRSRPTRPRAEAPWPAMPGPLPPRGKES